MNIFKKKPQLIIIPLVHNGVETGNWVECYEGDEIHTQLTIIYGTPLPKKIEIKPYES